MFRAGHVLLLILLTFAGGNALRALLPSEDGNKIVFHAKINVPAPEPVSASFIGTANVPLQITVEASHPLPDYLLVIFWHVDSKPFSIREILHGTTPEETLRVILPLLPSGQHVVTLRLQAPPPTDCMEEGSKKDNSAACSMPALSEASIVVVVRAHATAHEPSTACRGFVAPESELCTVEGFLSPGPSPEPGDAHVQQNAGQDHHETESDHGAESREEGREKSVHGSFCRLRPLLSVMGASRFGEDESFLSSYDCGAAETHQPPVLCLAEGSCTVTACDAQSPDADDALCRDGGDRGGDECSVNFLADPQFLPSAAALRRMREAAACAADPLRRQLLMELRSTLNPEDCSRALPAPFPGYGFAASFHYAALQLGRALRGNFSVSFPGEWLYADAGCERGSMDCAFQPASHTCPTDVPPGAWPDMVQRAAEVAGAEGALQDGLYACCSSRQEAAVDCRTWAKLYSQQVHDRCGEEDPEWIPERYRSRGKLWFRSMLAGYLFAPLPHVVQRVAEAAARAEWVAGGADGGSGRTAQCVQGDGAQCGPGAGEGVIGVHVRRGDACHIPENTDHQQHCVETAEYVQAIRAMRERYGYRRVLLATNGGAGLLEEFRRALEGMEVTAQPIMDRDKYSCCPEGVLDCSANVDCLHMDERLRQEKDRGAYGHEIIIDVILLAACDAFVGTMTSQVARLALELSYSWRGYVIPYVSLDIPWCWAGYKRQVFTVRGRTFDYGC